MNKGSIMEIDCQTVNDYIEDYLDGIIDDATQVGFQKHVEACLACQGRLARERVFRDALKSIPVPAPDPDFAACVFERAAAAYIRRPRINTSLMRLAASILVIIALGFIFKDTWRPNQPEWSEAFVRLNQPEEIRLVFYSKQDLDNITLRLEPPEGIELVGFENQREIVWQTDLVRGENLLVLPVIVRNREGGSLLAELRRGNQSKQFDLRIKVRQPKGPRPEVSRFEGRMVSTTTL
jgi:hypothetical protein